jgi:hypothetical protein
VPVKERNRAGPSMGELPGGLIAAGAARSYPTECPTR